VLYLSGEGGYIFSLAVREPHRFLVSVVVFCFYPSMGPPFRQQKKTPSFQIAPAYAFLDFVIVLYVFS